MRLCPLRASELSGYAEANPDGIRSAKALVATEIGMPNRIIRSELLDSEAWLSLKGNEDRCAYLALLLTADNFGDMPAGPHRLVRLWRPFGIDTPEKAAKALADLADADLIRRYEFNEKPYLHLPRFGQRMRYTRHAWPLSPWATIEDKHTVAKISPASSGDSRPLAASSGIEVEVEVNKKRKGSSTTEGSARETPQVKTVLENLTVKGKGKTSHRSREEQLAYVAAKTKDKP